MPEEFNFTPESIMKLQKTELKKAVLKLISNQELNDEEIAKLASHSIREIALVAVYITGDQLINLPDPIMILSTIASIHMNASKQTTLPKELQNYQKNMLIIQSIRDTKEKGTSR